MQPPCANCRRRKRKCDRRGPPCRACITAGEGSFCVFAGPPLSRTKESAASMLKTRNAKNDVGGNASASAAVTCGQTEGAPQVDIAATDSNNNSAAPENGGLLPALRSSSRLALRTAEKQRILRDDSARRRNSLPAALARARTRVHRPGTAALPTKLGEIPSSLQLTLATPGSRQAALIGQQLGNAGSGSVPRRAGGLMDWISNTASRLSSSYFSPSGSSASFGTPDRSNSSSPWDATLVGPPLPTSTERRTVSAVVKTLRAVPTPSESIKVVDVSALTEEERRLYELEALPCADAPYTVALERQEGRVRAAMSSLPQAVFRTLDDHSLNGSSAAPLFIRPQADYIEFTQSDLDVVVSIMAASQSGDYNIALEQVDYDIDSEDEQFLTALNHDRAKRQLPGLLEDDFERALYILERESFMRDLLTTEVPENDFDIDVDGAGCCICSDGQSDDTNVIVFCDGCDMGVHQECYGVLNIPEGKWFCQRCEARRKLDKNNAKTVSTQWAPSCVLCGQNDGAMMVALDVDDTESVNEDDGESSYLIVEGGVTTFASLSIESSFRKMREQAWDPRAAQWVHCVCALWVPETRFLVDTETDCRVAVVGVENIQAGRWELRCEVCNRKGACVQCNRLNHCATAFHPMCAQQSHLQLEMVESKKSGRVVALIGCSKHCPPRKPTVAEVLSMSRHQSMSKNVCNEQLPSHGSVSSPVLSPGGRARGRKTKFLDVYTHRLLSKEEAVHVFSARAIPSESPPKTARRVRRHDSPNEFLFKLNLEAVGQIWEHWHKKREQRSGHPLVKRFLKTFLLSPRTLPMPSQDEYEAVWKRVHSSLRASLARWRALLACDTDGHRKLQRECNVVCKELLSSLMGQNTVNLLVSASLGTEPLVVGPLQHETATEVAIRNMLKKHPQNAVLSALGSSAKKPLIYFDSLERKMQQSEYSSVDEFFMDMNALVARAFQHFESYSPEYKIATRLRLWAAELHRQLSLGEAEFERQWVNAAASGQNGRTPKVKAGKFRPSYKQTSGDRARRASFRSTGDLPRVLREKSLYDVGGGASSNLGSAFLDNLDGMLRRLWKADRLGTFANPVDPSTAPNYTDVISTPMCFSLIRSRLTSSTEEPYYSDMAAFRADMELVVANALSFNRPGSTIYKQAVRIGRAFDVMCSLEKGDHGVSNQDDVFLFRFVPHFSECLSCRRTMRGRPPLGGICWLCEPSKHCHACQTHDTIPQSQITAPLPTAADVANGETKLVLCLGCDRAFHKRCLSANEQKRLETITKTMPPVIISRKILSLEAESKAEELRNDRIWCCASCHNVLNGRSSNRTASPRIRASAIETKTVVGTVGSSLKKSPAQLVSAMKQRPTPKSPSKRSATNSNMSASPASACLHHRQRKRRCPDDCDMRPFPAKSARPSSSSTARSRARDHQVALTHYFKPTAMK